MHNVVKEGVLMERLRRMKHFRESGSAREKERGAGRVSVRSSPEIVNSFSSRFNYVRVNEAFCRTVPVLFTSDEKG